MLFCTEEHRQRLRDALASLSLSIASLWTGKVIPVALCIVVLQWNTDICITLHQADLSIKISRMDSILANTTCILRFV